MSWSLNPVAFIMINFLELPVIFIGKNIKDNAALALMLLFDYICLLGVIYMAALKTVVKSTIKKLDNDNAYIRLVHNIALFIEYAKHSCG